MKIKSAGAVAALPPLKLINVKKGEPINPIGIVSYKGAPHILALVPRLEASVLIKRERLVL